MREPKTTIRGSGIALLQRVAAGSNSPDVRELAAEALAAFKQGNIDRGARLAVQVGTDLCAEIMVGALLPIVQNHRKVTRARSNGKKAKASADYEKINAYIDRKLQERGPSKKPSLTTIRQDTAAKFDVSLDTVLRAQGVR